MDLTKNDYTKYIDYDKIEGCLRLREPQDGDYIVVTKDGGTKKLNRLFTAEKVAREKRATMPILAAGSEVVWAVGLRLSERFKITENTKTIMEINIIKGEQHA